MVPGGNRSRLLPLSWLSLALLPALLSALAGCKPKAVPEPEGASVRPAASASAEPSSKVKVEPALIASGRVVIGTASRGAGARLSIAAEAAPGPDGEAEVGALVTGRVARLLVAEGARVKKGETLAWVDAPEAARAAADLLRAKARVDVSAKKLARQTELLAQQATSQNAVDEAKAELAAARADIGAARTLLRSLGGVEPGGEGEAGGPSRVPVRSPLEGVVVRRDAMLGGPVSPDKPLFRVVAPERVIVVGKLPETAGPPPPDGTPATISPRGAAAASASAARAPCEALIEGSVAVLDLSSRTYPLRARPKAACPWLLPGAFAELAVAAVVPGGTGEGLFVPREAVVDVHGAQVVFVSLAEPGAFVARAVRVGEGAGELVRVDDGLLASDKLAVRGALLLKGELLRAELGSE